MFLCHWSPFDKRHVLLPVHLFPQTHSPHKCLRSIDSITPAYFPYQSWYQRHCIPVIYFYGLSLIITRQLTREFSYGSLVNDLTGIAVWWMHAEPLSTSSGFCNSVYFMLLEVTFWLILCSFEISSDSNSFGDLDWLFWSIIRSLIIIILTQISCYYHYICIQSMYRDCFLW